MIRTRLLCLLSVTLLAACAPEDTDALPENSSREEPVSPSHPDAGTPTSTPAPAPVAEYRPGPLPATTPPPPLPESPPPSEEKRPFLLPAVQTSLPEYELLISAEALKRFEEDLYAPDQDAVFRHAGVSYAVKVRLRGASARTFPKKSWNVHFEGARFQGLTSLNLVAEYADATMLAEKLAYDVLAALRVPAPRTKYVRLLLNGEYQGVFLDIEQVNKSFLRAHAFADKDATIYRTGWKDGEFKLGKLPYQGRWMKKTNEKEPDDALWEVLRVINHTPEPEFPRALERHLELEWLLRTQVMDALMSNNYIEDSESFFIHDRVRRRWVYVPWDLNNVDARWWYPLPVDGAAPYVNHPLFAFTLTDPVVAKRYKDRKDLHPGYQPVFSNLHTRVVMNPELRARLVARLRRALDELFTPEVMGAHIDALHALINPHMARDPYMDYQKFEAGRAFMKEFVRKRRAFVLAELDRYRAQKPGVVLEALEAREGWVELRNRGASPVSLAGMTLTTQLRVSLASQVRPPVGRVLPSLVLAPGERVRLTAAELGLTFARQGELGLFDGQSVVGVKDLLFYGELPPGKHYERAADATGAWRLR